MMGTLLLPTFKQRKKRGIGGGGCTVEPSLHASSSNNRRDNAPAHPQGDKPNPEIQTKSEQGPGLEGRNHLTLTFSPRDLHLKHLTLDNKVIVITSTYGIYHFEGNKAGWRGHGPPRPLRETLLGIVTPREPTPPSPVT